MTDIETLRVVYGADVSALAGAGAQATAVLDGFGSASDVAGTAVADLGASLDVASIGFDGLAASGDAAVVSAQAVAERLAILGDSAASASVGVSDVGTTAAGAVAALDALNAALAEMAAAADTASASLDTTSGSLKTTAASSKGLGGLGLVLAGVGVGAALLGVKAVKMAGDFQDSITQLATGAGESVANLKMVSDGILQMATQTGTSTKQLTDGMYMIESAGYHGAAGLQVLQAAAEGAKVGNASLADVANGVTTAMTDYSSSGLTAAQATNILIATVASGKTHMADLANSFASILPTASSVGVKFLDVSAAMATMTGEGVPAADAATYLRQMLMALENPSTKAEKVLKSIGLTSGQVAAEMKISLPETLKMIEDHLAQKFPKGSQEYVKAMAEIAGGTKQMQGMLDLTGDHLKTFEGNLDSISGSAQQGGSSITGWSEVQKDFNFKIDQAKASLETLGITLGTKLLPLLGPLIGNVSTLVSDFTTWINSGHAVSDALSLTGKDAQIALPILGGLAALVVTTLVPAFWSWAAATMAVVAAVGGIVAIFVALYQHSAPFKSFIDGLVKGFQQVAAWIGANFLPAMHQIGDFLAANVLPILRQLGGYIVSVFQPVWQNLVNLWNNQLLPLFKQLWGAIQPALPALKMLGEIVLLIVGGAFLVLIGIITGTISAIGTIISDLGSAIGGIVQIITGVVQVVMGVVRVIYDIFTGNWKDLGSALGSIWQGILNIFGGIFQTIGSLVHAVFGGIFSFLGGFFDGILGIFTGFKTKTGDVWHAITGAIGGAIGGAFSALGTTVHHGLDTAGKGIGNFFSGLGGMAHQGLQNLLNTFTAPFHAIGDLFSWLYNHNYYFKKLIDTIHAHVIEGLARLQGLWQNFLTWLTNLWDGLKDLARKAWQAASDAVMTVVQPILNWVHDRWEQLTSAVGGIWDRLKGFAQTAWDHVTGIFGNAWSAISGKLGDLWKQISDWFGNLAGQAVQWGQNLIQGIINGIGNMFSQLGQTLSNVAGAIANKLGFHSPTKEGPGRELDQWPRNMMRSYAAGIEAGIPQLQHSLNLVMQPVATTLSGGTAAGVSPLRVQAAAGGGQPIVVHNHNSVSIDGRQLADYTAQHMVAMLGGGANPRGGLY